MTLVKFTHTDGNDAYVNPEQVTAVTPPKAATPGPGVIPSGGPGAIVHLTCGYEVLVRETVAELKDLLTDAAPRN